LNLERPPSADERVANIREEGALAVLGELL